METLILLIIFVVLLITAGAFVLAQGTIQVAPRTVAILRNRITGKMVELTPFPALHFFLPGLYYIYRVVKCQKVVHDPDFVKVTTRDGQEVEVDYVLTLWPDFFDDNDQPILPEKSGNIIRLATTLEPGTEVEVAKNHTHAAIQRMFGNVDSYDLLKKRDRIPILCPDCHTKISNRDEHCPNPKCDQGKKNTRIPGGFYNRLGWSIGVRLDDFLEEKYGMGCWLEIQTVRYIGELRRAARAETMGAMEGRATKARLDPETKALKNLFAETGVNPTFGFVFSKLAEVVPEILANIEGKKKGGSNE